MEFQQNDGSFQLECMKPALLDSQQQEQKGAVETEHIYHSEIGQQQIHPRSNKWSTFPLSASLHFVAALLCVLAAAIFVNRINGHEQWQTTWNWARDKSVPVVSPQVILSALHALGTLELALAWSKACTLSWWLRATRGLRFKDLETNYRLSTDVTASLYAGRRFNLIGLATVTVALVGLIQGPLLQKSLSISSTQISSNTTITGYFAQILPQGYVGGTKGLHDYVMGSLTLPFTQVMKDYNEGLSILSLTSGCNGTCTATIEAIGLSQMCTVTINDSYPIIDKGLDVGTPLFDSRGTEYTDVKLNRQCVQLDVFFAANNTEDPPVANQNLTTCTARIVNYTCPFCPAIVRYPIIIQNNGENNIGIISIDTTKTPELEVVQWTSIYNASIVDSSVAAIEAALRYLYTSHFGVYYNGLGWAGIQKGSLAMLYMSAASIKRLQNDSNVDGSSSCAITFDDPMNDILVAINNIMLRTAISAGATNSSYRQTFPAQQTRNVLIYTVDSTFLLAAIAVTVVGVIVLVPLFWGWWRLERTPTFSPVEIAEAFGAPLLHDNKIYNDVNELLTVVGNWRLKYEEAGVSDDTVDKGGTAYRFQSLDDSF